MGRFTGWQITTMVVAFSIAIALFPVGVLAATGQLVNITDPVTRSYKARVNSSGRLLGDVRGAVTASYGAPTTAFSVATNTDATLQTLVPSFTSGKMMITSFTFSADVLGYSWIYRYTGGTCSEQSGYYTYMAAQDDTTHSATFPTPLVITQRCALLHVGGFGIVTITGYLVP